MTQSITQGHHYAGGQELPPPIGIRHSQTHLRKSDTQNNPFHEGVAKRQMNVVLFSISRSTAMFSTRSPLKIRGYPQGPV
jgi:hypothetical protein